MTSHLSDESLDRYRPVAQHIRSLLAARADPRDWIEANLRIRTKARTVIPFRLNEPQLHYYQNRSLRDAILKPRQLGFTSLICGLYFADTVLRPNTTTIMIAHDRDSTEKLFGIVQLFWQWLPEQERQRIGKPRFSNKREFFWPSINSRFFVGTAGSVSFGRGMTINNLHCSEFAFWPEPEEALMAALEAVPDNGRIVIESTACGMGNYFHDIWTQASEGRGRFKPQFYVWWDDPTYTAEGEPLGDLMADERELRRRWRLKDAQIRWRRQKVQDLGEKFRQEYPEDPVTCFLASGRCIFSTDALVRIEARIQSEAKPNAYGSITMKGGQMLSLAPATLLIWHQPQADRHYVIGADVGEGLPDGDASCAVVLDRVTGEQVAELHGRVPPDRFGHLLSALGWLYYNAEIAVERNNHGHSTLNTLRNFCQYGNLYYHVAYDSGAGRPKNIQLGWPTSSSTKPILVDDLAEAINSESLRVHSSGLINECFTFILTESGSAEAQPGKYDDRVMAAAIAWQVRKRPRSRASSVRPEGM